MRAVDLPPLAVRVLDPARRHRIFADARQGTRTGANRLGETTMSLVVHVAGRDYVVPPDWVMPTEGASNVLRFGRPAS